MASSTRKGFGMRLDQQVLALGLAESKSRAQALILGGAIAVNGKVVRKSGILVDESSTVTQVALANPYASRGGIKLAHALKTFSVSPQGWRIIDLGASTGGFTDCWLQHGAEQVYAVDVGYGQLAWKLRQDPRVHVFERTNARYLTMAQLNLSEPVEAASVDASFISLKLLLGPLRQLVAKDGLVIALIKPQFEAGPALVGKGGVVRDPNVHERVIKTVLADAERLGFVAQGLASSPIRGPEGNIEFLVRLGAGPGRSIAIVDVVEHAWQRGGAEDG